MAVDENKEGIGYVPDENEVEADEAKAREKNDQEDDAH